MKTQDHPRAQSDWGRPTRGLAAKLLTLLLLLTAPAWAGFGDCSDQVPGVAPDGGSGTKGPDGPGKASSGDAPAPAEEKPAKVVDKTVDIGGGAGELVLRFFFPKHDNYLERVDLMKPGSASPSGQVPAGVFINADDFRVEFIDMNFDGHKDFRIMTDEGERVRSEVYKYWLYEPAAKTFAPANLFDGMCSPSFDPYNKAINSACGSSGEGYILRTYTFVGGDLAVIREGTAAFYYNPTFTVRVIKPVGAKKPDYIEIAGEDGLLVCRTDKPPLACSPAQTVVLFTLAEEFFDADAMVGYYAPSVTWRGMGRSRSSLKSEHSRYLRSLKEGDLEVSNLSEEMSADGDRARVTCTVDGTVVDKWDQPIDFSVDKAFILSKSGGEWKIECEEVTKFNHIDSEDVTDRCRL